MDISERRSTRSERELLLTLNLKVESLHSDVRDLKSLSQHYATKAELIEVKASSVDRLEFEPVRRIVYGVVSIILAAVAAGIIGLVLTAG
jgi:hypothetical protein